MKITITKQQFLQQLTHLGRRFDKPEILEQMDADWDKVTGGAQQATLYLRGRNDYFDCHMASIEQTDFFNTYLPISNAAAH